MPRKKAAPVSDDAIRHRLKNTLAQFAQFKQDISVVLRDFDARLSKIEQARAVDAAAVNDRLTQLERVPVPAVAGALTGAEIRDQVRHAMYQFMDDLKAKLFAEPDRDD